MGISSKTYEQILKEYEELRRLHLHELEDRAAKVRLEIPEYADIEAEITSLYIKRTKLRIKPDPGISDEQLKARIDELVKKQDELLASKGLSRSYLQLEYTCPECKDTGYLEDGTKCSCFRQKITEKLYDFSAISDILNKENFKTFNLKYYSGDEVVTPDGKTAKEVAKEAAFKARDFVTGFDKSSENLFITGNAGVGKTFLSNCIAKEIIERGHSVIYLTAARLFNIMADATFGKTSSDDVTMDLIYGCDLLVIDDLGTELTNQFVQTGLFNCINERILRNKHTIISSNLSQQDLRMKYSERVFSRVVSSYTIIKLYANDIRIQKKMEA